ncbi:SDR family NAD(P)-dependent oxidoreductase [Oceanicola sp. S124]|uniref:SDR family NAD(P)-dependent oxidoreductase n=1 Tax=Oceanicola sp. S124 TaxID=1042378 RepID=UPI0002557990|nr:SDR family NAD(P)-dependent oxidoreductase [Oceanicola sp. S124]
MSKVLITGCSTGFGLATAQHFLDQGWDVVATMRDPAASTLPASDRLTVLALDVTDAVSIEAALADAGPLDALVNNAGLGMLNAIEGVSVEKIREVVETNLIGPIALIRAAMPGFRARGGGVVVNVSSSVTVAPLPALSVYTGSKTGLNGFTESFALEAAPQGVRTRLVLPGAAPSTDFGKNAMARIGLDIPAPYEDFVRGHLAKLQASTEVTLAEDVARAVWRAVTDPSAPMRIPAGADAVTAFRDAGWPVE